MNRKQRIISCLSLILFFNITKINSDFYILEPTSYYDDYFNKTIPKQYETVPNNDLNNNSDINKIDDFHYYFDDYDYYNNYKDFQYYDKKDDYYYHHYYKNGE